MFGCVVLYMCTVCVHKMTTQLSKMKQQFEVIQIQMMTVLSPTNIINLII